MNRLLIAAGFGFAFVAVWRFDGFDSALMCALGALVAVAAVLLVEGELDLGEVRRKLIARRRPSRQDASAEPATILVVRDGD